MIQKEQKKRSPYCQTVSNYCDSVYETFENADVVVLMTEWNQYRALDLEKVKSMMKGNVFVDLRNVYEKNVMEQKGFEYHCVGRS